MTGIAELWTTLGIIAFYVPLALVIAAILLGLLWLLRSLWLGVLIRLRWIPKGKWILFVYCDRPHESKRYIEEQILPRIAPQAMVLNLSSKRARRGLLLRAFLHWGQVPRYRYTDKRYWHGADFLPLAVIFRPWWNPRVLRFWRAFQDLEHSQEGSMKRLKTKLFTSSSTA